MRRKKVKEQMSIGIAVSFVGSSKKDFKIVTVHTVGSTVTVTTWESTTRAGANYIPSRFLKQMFENSGLKAIEVTKENGND
jgi:hypothetical protein